MAIALYNPDSNGFQDVDQGRTSEYNLLLNILIELRVHSQFLAVQNQGLIGDSLEQMRVDAVSDPSSLKAI